MTLRFSSNVKQFSACWAGPDTAGRAGTADSQTLFKSRYQEPSQDVKYNEVIFCEIKFRVWRAAGPRRPGAEQERSNWPNLNSSTWIWRNTQSKTRHSGSLCFYCPCFEAELLWWWRRYVFGLTESGISGFCGVVSLPCALRSLSGTHSTDSLSLYNEQS